MRLHRAADLRELPGEGGFQRGPVEAEHARRRRHGAEPAGGARPEEAEPGLRGEPQPGGDIHADGDRRDQLGAAHAAAQLGGGQRRGQDVAMACTTAASCRQSYSWLCICQALMKAAAGADSAPRAAPDRHGGIAPAGRDAQQPLPALDRRAGDADAEAVEHIDLGALTAAAGRSAKRVPSACAAKRAAANMVKTMSLLHGFSQEKRHMPQVHGPLQGVKVVACSTAQAGTVPYMLMADLGADVIKIEAPEGGDTRAA